MAAPYLTEEELLEIGIANGQRMDSTYSEGEQDLTAYGYASRRLGFSNPDSGDEDYAIKQYWLLQMMDLWFLNDQLRKYSVKFDVEGIKLSQVARGLRDMIRDIEKALTAAKQDPIKGRIFISGDDAAALFADTIYDSGIEDDALGNSYNGYASLSSAQEDYDGGNS